MNRAAVYAMVTIIEQRFDRALADRFADMPRQHGAANALRTRVLTAQPFDRDGYRVDDTNWRAAWDRDRAAVMGDGPGDEDGPEYTLAGGPWEAAEAAALDAMTAYVWPDAVTANERAILVDRWEEVFGPLVERRVDVE